MDIIGKSLARLLVSMIIFGTIGLFRRLVPLPSAAIAVSRGLIGGAFLVAFMIGTGKPIRFDLFRHELPKVLLSGAMIGFNWIFLFEAYNYTTVATATVCYYMAPVIVLLVSPFVLREQLNMLRIGCVLSAVAGMVLISGSSINPFTGNQDIRGIVLGLAAAALYAAVILINKQIHQAGIYERTFLQLFAAGAVTIPYRLWVEGPVFSLVTPETLLLVLFIGLFHTGFAYTLYFSSIDALPAHTVAFLSYLDPVTAVLLSVIVLHEPLTISGLAGMVLILGSTFISEGIQHQKRKT
ncbi:MAG: EamA family transporter [Clostridia bacterium]|nr:EamA family transporter [Clostridia bacterium]